MSVVWSKQDIEQLRELYSRTDITIDEVAVKLNKNLSAVTSKAKREGIKKARVSRMKNDNRVSNKLSDAERKEIIRRISKNFLSLCK